LHNAMSGALATILTTFLAVPSAPAAERFQADQWVTECEGQAGCSIITPFGQTGSTPGSGSFALALSLDGGMLTIVGEPPPLAATVQVDKNPSVRCTGPRYCIFAPGQSARLAAELVAGSLALVEVKTARGTFHSSLSTKGFQAGIAKLRAWSYPATPLPATARRLGPRTPNRHSKE